MAIAVGLVGIAKLGRKADLPLKTFVYAFSRFQREPKKPETQNTDFENWARRSEPLKQNRKYFDSFSSSLSVWNWIGSFRVSQFCCHAFLGSISSFFCCFWFIRKFLLLVPLKISSSFWVLAFFADMFSILDRLLGKICWGVEFRTRFPIEVSSFRASSREIWFLAEFSAFQLGFFFASILSRIQYFVVCKLIPFRYHSLWGVYCLFGLCKFCLKNLLERVTLTVFPSCYQPVLGDLLRIKEVFSIMWISVWVEKCK